MKTGVMILCVIAFIVGNVWSCILFKYAADSAGGKAMWNFILGNIVGILGPLSLTFALKYNNPNITYALCYGSSFAVLQLVSWRLFQQTLSKPQWAGVLLVGLGIFLLQLGARR